MSLGLSSEFRESTRPLLRPIQVEEAKEEVARLDATLNAPPHIASQVQDRAEMTRLRNRLRKNLDQQTPQPYAAGERDAAVRREMELRGKFVQGMCTAEEMRRNPPGATDKHVAWERRNKPTIAEWQNIRHRLHATACAGGRLENVKDIASIEAYRPTGLTRSMDMAGAQIAGGATMFFPETIEPKNQMSDEARTAAEAETLETMRRLAQGNPRYAAALAMLEGKPAAAAAAPTPAPAPKKRGGQMSAEARERLSQRMKTLNADRRAAKAGAAPDPAA